MVTINTIIMGMGTTITATTIIEAVMEELG
jgi:hypothetical protein